MNSYKLLKIAEGSDRSVSLGNRVVAWAMRRLFFCALGRHHGSRGHAKATANGATSRCKFCGQSMTKHFSKGWIISRSKVAFFHCFDSSPNFGPAFMRKTGSFCLRAGMPALMQWGLVPKRSARVGFTRLARRSSRHHAIVFFRCSTAL